jgi:hypothetical protein
LVALPDGGRDRPDGVIGTLGTRESGCVTGEEFLRDWAEQVVAAGDQRWYERFHSMVEVLEIVDEIDIDMARNIGQAIRGGLTARTG